MKKNNLNPDEFLKTKYAQYLVENFKTIEKERNEFNQELHNLLQHKTDTLGLILKCHLIIENYMDKLLEVSYPTTEWSHLRLNFDRKLEILNNPKSIVALSFGGIKELNILRNKFAHNIGYQFENKDLFKMHAFIDMWYTPLQKPIPKGLELVEAFTAFASSNLNLLTLGIQKHSKETGFPGYLIWMNEMME